MVNSRLLKNRMEDKSVTQEYMADQLKLGRSTFTQKLNNSRTFSIEEMFKVAEVLNIDAGELRQFFLL